MKFIIMHYNSKQTPLGVKFTSNVQHVKVIEWHVMAVPAEDEEVPVYDYASVSVTSRGTLALVLGGHRIGTSFAILKTVFLALKFASFNHLIAPIEGRVWVFN